MATIVVKGITPDLTILSEKQNLIYNENQINNTAFLGLLNKFTPNSSRMSTTSMLFSNHAFKGFIFEQDTTNSSNFGDFTFATYNIAAPGVDIFKYVESTDIFNLFKDLSLNNKQITNLAAGVNNSDAVNLSQLNQAIANLNIVNANGLVARTGVGTYSARNIVVGTGMSILNADGVSGNPTISLSTSLQNLSALATNGVMVRTGSNTYAARNIVSGNTDISITNQDGVSGNINITLNSVTLTRLQGYSASGTNFLRQDGTWSPVTNGTVTSVGISPSVGLTVSNSPITNNGDIILTLSTELQGLASLAANGFVARTAIGTYTVRNIVVGTGMSITNPAGTAGNPTISLNTELQGLASLAANGFIARTAAGTYAARNFIAGEGITITNPAGTAGNTTIDLGGIIVDNIAFTSASSAGNTSNTTNISYELGQPSNSFGTFNQTIQKTTNNGDIRSFSIGCNFSSNQSGYTNSLYFNYALNGTNTRIATYQSVGNYFEFNSLVYMNGGLNLQNNELQNIATPTLSNSAVTKAYADALITPMLAGISNLPSPIGGIVVKSGITTFGLRMITVGDTNLQITNGNGINGDPVITLNQQLNLTSQVDTESWRNASPQICLYKYNDGTKASFGFEVDTGFLKVVAGKNTGTRGVDFVASTGSGTTNFASMFKFSNDGTAFKIAGGTAWTNTSDRRIKTNIKDYKKGLKELLQIQPRTFYYNELSDLSEDNRKTEQIGVVAQEIEHVVPECVTTIETEKFKDFKLYDSNAILYILINSVKELHSEIQTLKSRL